MLNPHYYQSHDLLGKCITMCNMYICISTIDYNNNKFKDITEFVAKATIHVSCRKFSKGKCKRD